MTMLPAGAKVHLALGFIDMGKGMDGLAMLVQGVLHQDLLTALAARDCRGVLSPRIFLRLWTTPVLVRDRKSLNVTASPNQGRRPVCCALAVRTSAGDHCEIAE